MEWANGGTGRRVGLKIRRIHKLLTLWYSNRLYK